MAALLVHVKVVLLVEVLSAEVASEPLQIKTAITKMSFVVCASK